MAANEKTLSFFKKKVASGYLTIVKDFAIFMEMSSTMGRGQFEKLTSAGFIKPEEPTASGKPSNFPGETSTITEHIQKLEANVQLDGVTP